jgi:hypothetical protein
MKKEITIRKWLIYEKFGSGFHWIIDMENIDASEDEIALCVQEQIFEK